MTSLVGSAKGRRYIPGGVWGSLAMISSSFHVVGWAIPRISDGAKFFDVECSIMRLVS